MAAGFDPFLERARKAVDSVQGDPEAMITETFGAQP